MRKEVFFAILAGVSIGLLIAFGAWRVAQSFKRDPIVKDSKKLPPPINAGLTLNNLLTYDVITELPLLVSGISMPDSEIVLSTTEKDYYTRANNFGEFEVEIELPSGLSEININEQKLRLVYSTEIKLEDDSSQKAIAYTGTVTDLSANAVQVKSDNGEIKQLSYSEDTVFVNTNKKNALVKSEDLAIGDYIIALGLENGKVLASKRVLISSPISENEYQIISGNIQSIVKNKITLTRPNGETFEITMPKTWNGPELKDLSEGQRIITVGITKDETYSLRTLFTPVE
ncbi:MAG: hypothetical protein QY322_00030 [bacterium]|nr:MAG: hypothetical protein QY322_00030 [bacterium]